MGKQAARCLVAVLTAAAIAACAAPAPTALVEETVLVEAPAAPPEELPAAEEAAPAEPSPARRLVVIHDGWLGLYAADGTHLSNIDTRGRARVTALSDRFLVEDREQARLFDLDGTQLGQNMLMTGADTVVASPERIVIPHDGWTAIYDVEGQPVANVGTSGRAQPLLATGRVVLAGDSAVHVYDVDGMSIANLVSADAEVQLVDDSIVLHEGERLRVFALNDGALRLAAPLSSGSGVAFGPDRVAVAHDGWVTLHDLSGQAAVNVESLGVARISYAGDRLVIVDEESVRVYGPDGEQVAQSLPGSPQAEVTLDGDRILVCQDGWLGLYDGAGGPVANLDCAGRPDVQFAADRIVVADTNTVRIFDRDGGQLGQTRRGQAEVVVGADAGLLAVVHQDWAEIMDLQGQPVSTVPVRGPASVQIAPDGILVIDGRGARAYALDGSPAGQAIAADSPSDVQVLR